MAISHSKRPIAKFGLNKPIQTGSFGADMKVRLLNNEPLTIIIDSKDKK